MGTTNYHRTRGHHPRSVGENRDDSSLWEDNEPNEGSGQTNVGIRNALVGLKKLRTYTNFALLQEFLQGAPTIAEQNVWFMHDGASTHFSSSV
ncbi:hypothetical protein TNCV_3702871 [Trichonephila clavipes]|nr:hypothetical protein TNCV_3702871 [Trichonephila clavipes]